MGGNGPICNGLTRTVVGAVFDLLAILLPAIILVFIVGICLTQSFASIVIGNLCPVWPLVVLWPTIMSVLSFCSSMTSGGVGAALALPIGGVGAALAMPSGGVGAASAMLGIVSLPRKRSDDGGLMYHCCDGGSWGGAASPCRNGCGNAV